GTVTYVLSHSHRAEVNHGNLQEGKSEGLTLTVTWFGRRVRAREIPTEGPFCPLCERCYPLGEWLELEWVGQGPPPTEPMIIDWSEWRAFALDRTGLLGRSDRIELGGSEARRPAEGSGLPAPLVSSLNGPLGVRRGTGGDPPS